MTLSSAAAWFVIALSITASGGLAATGWPQKSGSTPAGTAKGALTVGSSKLQLSHAYALPVKDTNDPAKENYHLFVTNRAVPVSSINDVTNSQEVALLLLEHEVKGLHAVVTADNRVLRVSVRHPELDRMDMTLGVTLIQPTSFQATVVDQKQIAGKLFTGEPFADPRTKGKNIQYEVTFSTPIHRSAAK